MPVAVVLLQWIGVVGCGCLSPLNVSLVILASFVFKNSSPSSASAADYAINLSI